MLNYMIRLFLWWTMEDAKSEVHVKEEVKKIKDMMIACGSRVFI